MKITRKVLLTFSASIFLGVAWPVEAQRLASVSSSPGIRVLESGEIEIDLQPVLSPPQNGTFLSLQLSDIPPLPFNPFPEFPVYALGDIFIYDDWTVDYVALREQGFSLFRTVESESVMEGSQMMTANGLTALGEGEPEEGASPDPLPLAFSYTSGLWLNIFSYNSNWMTLELRGTVENDYYEILTKTNLSETNWKVDHGFIGQTDLTLAQPIWLPGRSNLFFWARNSGLDSDGDGLPDWWETEHDLNPNLSDTGNTGTSDGYKDADGDGWNNIEEYQNGTSPGGFNTPAAPRGLTVALNTNGTVANLSWNPSGGAVTGYTIERTYYETGTDNFSVAASSHTYSDTTAPIHSNPYSNPPSYRIQAHYAAGNSAWSAGVSIHPAHIQTMFWQVRGPNGRPYLVSSGMATDIIAVRFISITQISFSIGTTNIFILQRSSFTNGVALIPESQNQIGKPQSSFAQAVSADGSLGEFIPVANGYHQSIPFFDGREQLSQNLSFLLRAADKNKRFQLFLQGAYWDGTYSDPYSDGYAYASYYNIGFAYEGYYPSYTSLKEFRPFIDNYNYRNFVLDPTHLDNDGQTTTGAEDVGSYAILHLPATYQFQSPTNVASIPALLTPSVTTNLISPYYVEDIGVSFLGYDYIMESNPKNLFGLSYLSAREPHDGIFTDLYPGGVIPEQGNYLYPNVARPVTHVLNYYFGRQYEQDQPGQLEFSPTNVTPNLFVSGNDPSSYPFFGYAKLALDNGDTNQFGYLGVYFDKAYKVNTDGTTSTNQNGLLSEYGEYFPFEPGRVLLTTKPMSNSDTNIGRCIVNVIKLELDVNHDGTIDHSITGPDNASYLKPFVFWVNNDNDGTGVGQDIDTQGKRPDHIYQGIRSRRNLEDFARLWISGIPTLPSGYQVSLSWNVISGTPSINLYRASETQGGIGYLTNAVTAVAQIASDGGNLPYSSSFGPGIPIAIITNGTACVFPDGVFNNAQDRYFLFEGAGIGKGKLVLTISQGTNTLAQTSAFIEIKDVKEMYERAKADNVSEGFPPSDRISRFQSIKTIPMDSAEARQVIVFVHGINNTEWEYENTSETMFKRLYWSGYQGRFVAFRWPSPLLPDCAVEIPRGSPFDYNKGEYIAWKSANAFATHLIRLRERFPNHTINVIAHSMGGIVASEALRLGAPFDNCILSQAAVPAHSYDVNAPFLQKILTAEQTKATPLQAADGGYHGYFTNLTGNIVNFYNTNDYALVSGTCGIKTNWEKNHESQKPEEIAPSLVQLHSIYGYSTNTLDSYVDVILLTGTSRRVLTDSYEKKAMVARSRSQAVGGQAGVAGVINTNSFVDLRAQFGFTGTREEHSAQFTRNIQNQMRPFYRQIMQSFEIPVPIQ